MTQPPQKSLRQLDQDCLRLDEELQTSTTAERPKVMAARAKAYKSRVRAAVKQRLRAAVYPGTYITAKRVGGATAARWRNEKGLPMVYMWGMEEAFGATEWWHIGKGSRLEVLVDGDWTLGNNDGTVAKGVKFTAVRLAREVKG